jgi:hypothetical protein
LPTWLGRPHSRCRNATVGLLQSADNCRIATQDRQRGDAVFEASCRPLNPCITALRVACRALPKNSPSVAYFSAASWTAPRWAIGRGRALNRAPTGQSAGSNSICLDVLKCSVLALSDSRPRSDTRVLLAERCNRRPRAFEERLSFPISCQPPHDLRPTSNATAKADPEQIARRQVLWGEPGALPPTGPFASPDRLRGTCEELDN